MNATKTPVKPTPEQLKEHPDATLTPDGFFAGGPTLEEYVAAGYKAEDYPPDGYARFAPQEPPPQEPPPQAPILKHYEAHNSNRAINGPTRQYHFSPYVHLAGTWMGTYSTDDPIEQSELDAMVKSGKHGVYAMTSKDHENAMKKKAHTLQGLGQSLIHSEQAIRRGQPSAQTAAPLDTEPVPPKPPVPESAATIQTGDSKVPEAAS
jgi:hypothetical protein